TTTPPTPGTVTEIELPSSVYVREMSKYNADSVLTDNKANIEGSTLADNSTVTIGGNTTNYFEALNSVFDNDKSSSVAADSNFNVVDQSNLSPWLANKLQPNPELELKTVKKGENQTEFNKAYLKVPSGEFTLEDGWYINNDKTLIIGSDDAKDLVVTNEANKDNAEYTGKKVVVLEDGQTPPRVFGGDNSDDITIDNVSVDFVSTGTGDDKVTLKNGAKVLKDINTGDGEDTVNVDGASTEVKGNIFTNAGDDTINITNKGSVAGNINSGDGKDTITVNNATVEKNIYGREGDDEITLDKAAVKGNVEAGKGAGKVDISGGTIVEGHVRSGIEREIIEKGDTTDNHDFAGNVNVTIKNSTVNKTIDLNGLGDREITLDKSTVHGTIYAGHYSDSKITVKDSKVGFKILGEGGNDTIVIDNSTIGANPQFKNEASSVVFGDGSNFKDGNDIIEIKNNSIIQGGIEGGGGNDTVKVVDSTVGNSKFEEQNKAAILGDGIDSKQGNDTIGVENSTIIGGIDAGGGNDTIITDGNKSTITGQQQQGGAGDDTIITNNGGDLIIESMEGSKTIDLSNISSVDKNIKSIDLSQVDGAKLNITAQDVLDVNKANGSEILTIKGGSDDLVSKTDSSEWTKTSGSVGEPDQYSTQLQPSGETVIIKIDQTINTDLV
ncbi:hypothetical protein, partial [Campylobacter sp. RM16190]|uniref:hypothetical protein n=1 Tax=Campylobacter sp. RM16190 TaxID=1705727 RepID=UPI001472C8AD